jgi:aryl-alcohol dehydrogenase-like predicted oxidoreductase
MEYRRLGRCGLQVSPLCLGTMNFGWVADEKQSFAVMDRALEAGINFFDTADVYGAWSSHAGACEELIGRWLAQGGRRENIILATKVYNPTKIEGCPAEINRDSRCYSAPKIIRHCEASLRRLGVETIDLYQLHHIDRECPMDEMWDAMQTLQRQGKIIYVGSSNFAGWDIATACMTASARHHQGLASEQSIYHLAQRMIELEVIPACAHFGLALIPWSPVGGGLLGGVLKKQKDGRRAGSSIEEQVEKKRPQLEQWESFCETLGHPPADVAVAWLLHNPVVTAPIIGPRSVEQLEGALRSLEIKLTAESLAELDKIFPGPGGAAPNAYAW